MKPLTPDKRAGLSVTGLLLMILAVALGAASYKLNGLPELPMKSDEATILGSAVFAALAGFACLLKGTEASPRVRK